MVFRFHPLALPGLIQVEPPAFEDRRGVFMEAYKHSEFVAQGIPAFVQDNLSWSVRGTLRGLHYQKHPKAQGKLVTVLAGEIFDVGVDLREGSPTFKRWIGVTLSSQNRLMLYVPEGFAHGFCVLSEEAAVLYKVTAEYAPELDTGICWNDPELSVRWPVADPLLSEKDARLPTLAQAGVDFAYRKH